MRKNNSKVLRKPNKFVEPKKSAPSSNGLIKASNGSRSPLNASKKPTNIKTNSTEKSSWKDDRELDKILQLGIDFQNKGEYQAAIHAYERAIQRSPQCSYAYWLLGAVHYVFLNDPKSAIPFFQEAVKLSPKTEKGIFGRCCSILYGKPTNCTMPLRRSNATNFSRTGVVTTTLKSWMK